MKLLREPFALVLLDNHPDDQPGAFGDTLLSCGNWVAAARRDLPLMRADAWVRHASDVPAALAALPDGIPLFLSIDLDVLSPAVFRTGWDQGEMSFAQLLDALRTLCRGRRLTGIDICGASGTSLSCDVAQNAAVLNRLEDFLLQELQRSSNVPQAASTR